MTEETEPSKHPKTRPVAPGEGERRAQRGYVPQYDLGARLIYEGLAAGRLQWIGLADRGAGAFDDIVLGLRDRVVAYQVKTSRDPEPFSIRTILLGAEDLLSRMLETRGKLAKEFPELPIETAYACDDYPRTDDKASGNESSAAFLRTHAVNRLSWTIADWRASLFAEFVEKVQAASRLDDQEFEKFWRHTRFLTRGEGRSQGAQPRTSGDAERIREIAALLPRLVSDVSDRDRWTTSELLSSLQWDDPFSLRHGHNFPVDALYQSNAVTQQALQQVLSAVASGYVSLVGPPGSGKSTLLAAGLLPTSRAVLIRYLAFVPNEGQGLGRGEAFDFLHDIVKQLKQQNLGTDIIPGSVLPELREQLQRLLKDASSRFEREGIRTLVVVDGLDHIPREEKPEHSFLSELPQPHAVPKGVVFLLGTQRLDLADIPPSVADQARQDGRCVAVSPLSREAVFRIADGARLPAELDRDDVYSRTGGHPLSVRYFIEQLRAQGTTEAQKAWLQSSPAFDGDVDAFYQRAWHELERQPKAREALAYIALAEGPLSPDVLERLVGTEAAEAAWNSAHHLLQRDYRNAWSIFHNSFRLFLRARTGLRYGLSDESLLRGRYERLADAVRDADPDDPQRWMELRYRARAADFARVAELTTPERFRRQFTEGRSPGDIQDDIALGFRAAGSLRRCDLVVDLMLARHEIAMRSNALGDEVFDALVVLGDRRAALGLLEAEGVKLKSTKGFELIDAFLEAGELNEARNLFDAIEPIGTLLGAAPLEPRSGDTDELEEWAERALVFREPAQVVGALARLRPPDERYGERLDVEAYCTKLRLAAARGQLRRHPELSPEVVLDALKIGPDYLWLLQYEAMIAAFEADRDGIAGEHLNTLLSAGDRAPSWVRRGAARVAVRLGRRGDAASLLAGVSPPTLKGHRFGYERDELGFAAHKVFLHASLVARLGQAPVSGAEPEARLLATLQRRLEVLGRLLGDGREGRQPSLEPMRELRDFLTFLERAEGDEPHSSDRMAVDDAMDVLIQAIVVTAHSIGPGLLSEVVAEIDARLDAGARRLGRPRVRRAYAVELFKLERDSTRAEWRISYDPGKESSPSEALAEAARTAQAYAAVGLKEVAHRILSGMHVDGLGISLPPRKDPQYLAWRDTFVRACEEDPAGRPKRLVDFGRFLSGLAKTEGDGAARRVVDAYLEQSAQAGPAWAKQAAELADRQGLASWSTIVRGLSVGVAKRNPQLSRLAAVIVGRLALPFSGEHGGNPYPELIRVVPDRMLPLVLSHAINCLEVDCHQANRMLFLEQILNGAKERGCSSEVGHHALTRWRSELPPPRSGSSPEDPFFLVRTLDELSSTLQRVGDGSTSWGAARAFVRIAPKAAYDAAKATFDAHEVIQRDDAAIETLAHAALSIGRRDGAEECLERLKELAAERGGWSDGWSSDTTQRYHRVNVMMRGEVARQAAFDAFVDDLASRRVTCYLLPDLCDVLELLSPRPTWAETWARLELQLREFREHRLGTELVDVTDHAEKDEQTLAEILFRGLSTTAVDLTKAARATSVELARTEGGTTVVAILIERLWGQGGRAGLEAAQIAWECRDVQHVQAVVSTFLDQMLSSDDIVVGQTAAALAREWGRNPEIKHRELPALYTLELPREGNEDHFELPSGLSQTSPGLHTDDIHGWTWPLRSAFEAVAKVTGIDGVNLRARAVQRMESSGGREAFGPEAFKREQARLKRLGLESIFRRIIADAALQAGRDVVGELVAADRIDPSVLPLILLHLGAFPAGASSASPVPRPVGIPSAGIETAYSADGEREWLDRVVDDTAAPTLAGHVVLAAASRHERRHLRDEWCAERYWGPEPGGVAPDLLHQIERLPRAIAADRLDPLYDGTAPAGVVYVPSDVYGAISEVSVALCPRAASELGWHPDPRDLFTYLDESGVLVAQTLFWRDGGVRSNQVDSGIFSVGCVLAVRQDHEENLRRLIAMPPVSIAWRAVEHERGARTANSAIRRGNPC